MTTIVNPITGRTNQLSKINIKKINENIQINQNELDTLAATSSEYKESIDTLSKNLADIEEYAANSRNLITELEVFMAKLSTLNHLMEVDKIWKQTEEHQLRINRVEQDGKSYADKLNELMQVNDRMSESISLNARDINSLKEYQGKLATISHLDDVDSIWNGFYHIRINDEHSYYFQNFIFVELSKYRKDRISKILKF